MNKTIGILGSGQLAKMLVLEGSKLGFRFLTYGKAGCADDLCKRIDIGSTDEERLKNLKLFNESVDLITLETENIDLSIFDHISKPIYPSPKVLGIAQDRLLEKNMARSLGISTADFIKIDSDQDIDNISNNYNKENDFILKTRKMGYDGKSQIAISGSDSNKIKEAWAQLGKEPCVLESKVEFTSEASALIFRDANKNKTILGPIKNIHKDKILYQSFFPSGLDHKISDKITSAVTAIAQHLDLIGILCVEFFIKEGDVIFNEMAPRVHNSGHCTLDSCSISQFEQQIRAITGLPMPNFVFHSNVVMQNLIGDHSAYTKALGIDSMNVHLYNKEPRPGRKVGHINRTIEKNIDPIQYLGDKFLSN